MQKACNLYGSLGKVSNLAQIRKDSKAESWGNSSKLFTKVVQSII
jgi:hypothetical protein